ncbi:MAG TPA: type II toxin-antitoxin system HipA family toxin YjjJ, partial [Rudaea sp.]
MNDARLATLQAFLHSREPASAAEIARALAISQPTVSRLLGAAGDAIVRIGRARAARYTLARPIARAGSHWPLYRLNENAEAQTLGELYALPRDAFYFETAAPRPTFLQGDFSSGLFPGLPWFLDDLRPQGFLGRALARRIAADIGAPDDLARWQTDDILLALLTRSDDPPGDLIVGEASLQRALKGVIAPSETVATGERATRYPQLAEDALRGESVGSSAGGEQPKFAVTLQDGKKYTPVIVKFSERMSTPAGRRWADLLIAEQRAGDILRSHRIAAAHSELFEAGGRMFLQSTRFDRTRQLGRRGLVSLHAVDAGFYGHGLIDWWRFAPQLERDGWLGRDDARRLALLGWFGALIANTDMHLGNASLFLTDTRPLALAPLYDMLPMRFRPASSGEVIERRYEITPPTPEHRDTWRKAAALAVEFWDSLAGEASLSRAFRVIATKARD